MSGRPRSMRLLLSMLLCLVLAAGWLAVSADVTHAQTDVRTEGFRCEGGTASGKLYDSGASCPTTLTFDNIFSFFICSMEQLTSSLMGNMYCGMVTNLTPMVMAVLTLAVLCFGMGFTIGVIPATAREFQKFLLKVAFIYVFATQSEFLITYGYRFLIQGAREGIAIALSGLYNQPGQVAVTSGADVYSYLDRFLGRALQFATDSIGASWAGNSPTGDNNPCRNAIFAVMAIMAVAFPPLFFLSLLIIVKVALTFVRGVFGYVYAIVGIAFLLSLAPFFLSFYLFQQTRSYFDKWLGYLISFTLQMVIVFAFLAFVVSIDVKNLSSSIVNIIVPVQESPETTALRFPWRYCTLCDFEVITRDETGAERIISGDEYEDFLGKGELRCKQPVKPIRALSAIAPEKGQGAPDTMVQNALLKFTGTALLSLLVLAFIIDGILGMIPFLAQKLAGGTMAPYAPQLGGGMNPNQMTVVDIPGMGQHTPQGYTGIFGSFERGFYRGFSSTRDAEGNAVGQDSISRTARGVAEGFGRMVGGAPEGSSDRRLDPSLGERFIRYLASPIRSDPD